MRLKLPILIMPVLMMAACASQGPQRWATEPMELNGIRMLSDVVTLQTTYPGADCTRDDIMQNSEWCYVPDLTIAGQHGHAMFYYYDGLLGTIDVSINDGHRGFQPILDAFRMQYGEAQHLEGIDSREYHQDIARWDFLPGSIEMQRYGNYPSPDGSIIYNTPQGLKGEKLRQDLKASKKAGSP